MNKRPVIFVVETGSQAGGVKVIGEMANRLAQRDWPVSIWSVNPKETLTSWFPLSPLVKWVSFFKTGTVQDYGELATILTKQRGIKVATFWRTAFAVADCAEPGEGHYLVQDVESSYVSQRLLADMVMSTYKMPLIKFTTSKWVQGILPDIQYVGIGLENHWRPNTGKRLRRNKTVLACARMQSLKGWDFLCEVSRYISTANVPIVTYGHNEKLPMFAEVKHIKFPSDAVLRRMYQEAGVFISQSTHEGFNLTLLEAMSCGTPCVTTNSHGNMEYVRAGENCILENDPLQFARAVVHLLNDDATGKRLGEEAAKARSAYNWNDVIDRLEGVFLDESPNLESAEPELEMAQ